MKKTKKFYGTYAWKKKRKDIRKRDNNECQECKRNGKYSNAKEVHHKEHLEQRPDLALDENNLEALCKSCHDKKHPEKYHALPKQPKKFINEERW